MAGRRSDQFGNLMPVSIFRFKPAIVFLVLFCSCSVKEDRRDCPCLLEMTLARVPEVDGNTRVNISLKGNRTHCTELVELGRKPDTMRFSVFREQVLVEAMLSEGTGYLSDMIIPFGSDAFGFYAGRMEIPCYGETSFGKLLLDKQFARISLTLIGDDENLSASWFAVRGNVCGWHISDYTPIEGNFYHSKQLDSHNVVTFTVPRQLDDSMMLDLILSDSGGVSASLALGKEMSERGYDWTRSNLPDVSMVLQYSAVSLVIVSCEWSEAVVMEVEI